MELQGGVNAALPNARSVPATSDKIEKRDQRETKQSEVWVNHPGGRSRGRQDTKQRISPGYVMDDIAVQPFVDKVLSAGIRPQNVEHDAENDDVSAVYDDRPARVRIS